MKEGAAVRFAFLPSLCFIRSTPARGPICAAVGISAVAAMQAVISAIEISIVGRRPNFFATNDEALADMRRLADQEAAAAQ